MIQFFENHLLDKKGGGRDHMSPEKLICKNKNKKPRVISIPTIRDRLVLGVLAKYLQNIFPECINHDLPNAYINKIKKYIEENEKNSIYFIRTDFESFYDSIKHNILIKKLKTRITDNNIIYLISNAIKTPTLPRQLSEKNAINSIGVPQGLAISNILAQIYTYNFDVFMKKGPCFFMRYVDDILLLCNKKSTLRKKKLILKFIRYQYNLRLSKSKTFHGNLRNKDIDYLGYLLNSKIITIRPKNVQTYLDRLAAKCTKFNDHFINKEKRSRLFMDDDNLFINTFFHEINLMICGSKSESKLYGWLPFFIQMNDLSLLFQLDKILNKFINRIKCFENNRPKEIKTFIFAYYNLKYKNGGNAIFNYDKITTITQKISYLIQHGQINNEDEYSNEQIEKIFSKYKRKNLSNLEQDQGNIY